MKANNTTNILTELSSYVNSSELDKQKQIHRIHPYPAKFISQIPSRIIEEFSNERHIVLDPFCGSGTTLLEAKMLGRDSIGFDINPIGVLISRVKTQPLNQAEFDEIDIILNNIKKKFVSNNFDKVWIPKIPRIEHWFTKEAQKSLGVIAFEIKKTQNIKVRRLLNLCLSSIILPVSNQESETRFAAVKKNVTTKRVFELFHHKIENVKKSVMELSEDKKSWNTKTKVFLADITKMSKYIKPKSVDLVITSPPYLNSFDYYLYHKFRMYWLGYEKNSEEMLHVDEVKEKEIGSRYEFSGEKSQGLDSFKKNMVDCFREIRKVTKPGKMIFILVGDSIVKGKFIRMDGYYKQLGEECGLKFLSKTSYPMMKISRSFVSQNTNKSHVKDKLQHILIFQNTAIKKLNSQISKYNPDLAVEEIPKNVSNGSKIVITSNNVTKYTHGLVKYPAKFIPHIPRWAIKTYSKQSQLVLDPFGGCGTTMVEASIYNRKSIGIDINPVAALYANVKVNSLDKMKLQRYLKKIIQRYDTDTKSYASPEFPLREFWFSPDVLHKIEKVKKSICNVKEKAYREFFLVVLASIIKAISYLDESQIKVKRSHKKFINGVPEPIVEFEKKALKSIQSMEEFSKNVKIKNSVALIGDAKKLPAGFFIKKNFTKLSNVDLVVTSPPYINAMNYPMYSRYELLLLELIKSENYINHQTKYIGTERVYVSEYPDIPKFGIKKNKYRYLNQIIKKVYGRERKRAYIIKKYFDDMSVAIGQIYKVLKKKGKFVMVCGSNTIKNVYVPTCDILTDISKDVGFRLVKSFEYEIRNHRFKISRHSTGRKITIDKVMVMEKI